MSHAYIFDLDGIIIEDSIFSKIYHAVIEALIRSGMRETEIQEAINKLENKRDSYELCKSLNAQELYCKVLGKYVRHSHAQKSRQTAEVFKKIKSAKKTLGIISNYNEKIVRLFLERYGLSENADFIEGGDKTKVLFWVMLEKKHFISKANTLVIGISDAVLDIARHCGYKALNADMIAEIEKFSY